MLRAEAASLPTCDRLICRDAARLQLTKIMSFFAVLLVVLFAFAAYEYVRAHRDAHQDQRTCV